MRKTVYSRTKDTENLASGYKNKYLNFLTKEKPLPSIPVNDQEAYQGTSVAHLTTVTREKETNARAIRHYNLTTYGRQFQSRAENNYWYKFVHHREIKKKIMDWNTENELEQNVMRRALVRQLSYDYPVLRKFMERLLERKKVDDSNSTMPDIEDLLIKSYKSFMRQTKI